MPHATGQAASFDVLLHTIIQTAALAGWTDHDDGFLSRPGCAVRLSVLPADGNDNSFGFGTHPALSMVGGSAVVDKVLQNQSPGRVRMYALRTPNAPPQPTMRNIVFPVFYDIIAHPDEVYIFMNHGEQGIPPGHTVLDEFQYLAFGTGNVPGLPGSGAWISGTFSGATPGYSYTDSFSNSFAMQDNQNRWGDHSSTSAGQPMRSAGAIFASTKLRSQDSNSFVHHGFTDFAVSTWNLGRDVSDGEFGQMPLLPLLFTQPSGWNDGAALLPIRAYIPRPQGFMTLVADLRHARNVRIDNLDPKEIYTLGTERWMVFPWAQKNLVARNGGNGINHSGTFGVAVRLP
jgi:hypothetical protein